MTIHPVVATHRHHVTRMSDPGVAQRLRIGGIGDEDGYQSLPTLRKGEELWCGIDHHDALPVPVVLLSQSESEKA